jgi:hypothetical protein
MINRSSLEANIVTHCNLKCTACSHGSPFGERSFMEPSVLSYDLSGLSGILHVSEFMILGGEPLLHPNLPKMIGIVQDSQIADHLVVSTNGTLLHRQSESFWKSLEGLILRITDYPGTVDMSNKELAERKKDEFGFSVQYWHHPRFFYQFANTPPEVAFARCPWKNQCLTIHNHILYRCPQSAFFPGRFIPESKIPEGLSIIDLSEQSLYNFLNGNTPLHTCNYCDASYRELPWSMSQTKEEWIEKSTWRD